MSGYTVGEEVEDPRIPLPEDGDWRSKFRSNAVNESLREPHPIPLMSVADLFENRDFVGKLQKEVTIAVQNLFSPKPTEGSLVYQKLLKNLDIENTFKDKYIAIDVKNEEIIGTGDTLEEAYADARSKSKSRNLYFRKVGQNYLFRV